MSGIVPTLVAARAKNGVIGRNGQLPWRMKSDLDWFKKVTMGKPVIMGRKTFESIGKPLPGRTNIVVTRQGDYEADGALVVHGLTRAFRIAEVDLEGKKSNEVCIIGGGEIYREAMDHAMRLYLTTVEADVEGDTTFPEFDEKDWTLTINGSIKQGDGNDYAAAVEVWDRQTGG